MDASQAIGNTHGLGPPTLTAYESQHPGSAAPKVAAAVYLLITTEPGRQICRLHQ